MKLNKKHKEFCQLILQGTTHAQAYSVMFPNNKTPETSASRLLKNVKIKAFLSSIEQEAHEAAKKHGDTILNRVECLKIFSSIGRDDEAKASDRINATSKLGEWRNYSHNVEKSEAVHTYAVSDSEIAEREKYFKEKLDL